MATKRLAALSILAAAVGAWAEAGELRVVHSPRPCILSGQFTRIEARFEPASDRIRAQVLFHRDGEAQFYAVEMRREGALWVAVLPSPAPDTARVAYFITGAAADGSRARAPASSAFLVDVGRTPCAEGALPVSATGPSEVAVPRGSPQGPPGFERRGIGAFVVAAEDEVKAAAQSPAAGATPFGVVPIALGSKVRVGTGTGKRQYEGKLVSLDGEALVLDAGGSPDRIPRSQVMSLEVREKGSSGMRILGGLGGAVAGLAVVALICASGDNCESVGIAWAGLGVGAVAGAALTGGGSWKPVALASAGRVELDLRGRPAGATVELRVGF
jgi:hypothetical protein